MYFPGRAATIYYRKPVEKKISTSKISELKDNVASALHVGHDGDIEIGSLGILHPTVLVKFEIAYPCSALEFTLEPFKRKMHKVWTNEEWS